MIDALLLDIREALFILLRMNLKQCRCYTVQMFRQNK